MECNDASKDGSKAKKKKRRNNSGGLKCVRIDRTDEMMSKLDSREFTKLEADWIRRALIGWRV